MLQGLQHLHGEGLIHRDLKPANVLLSKGRVKICDLGLTVRASTVHQPVTFPNRGGTLLYQAPEQVDGVAYSKPIDMWAAGLIMHEMLTGRHILADHRQHSKQEVQKIISNLTNEDLQVSDANLSRMAVSLLSLLINAVAKQ